jgi:hypothetical protein
MMQQLQALMRSPQVQSFYNSQEMKMLQDYRSGRPVNNIGSSRPAQFLPQQPGLWTAPPAPPAPPPINLGGVTGSGSYAGGEGAGSSPDGGLGQAAVDGLDATGIGAGMGSDGDGGGAK